MGAPALHAQNVPAAKGFSCGLNAAYIFLNRAGHHASYEALVGDFLGQTSPDTLLAIKTVLKIHGCETVGLQTAPEYFLTSKNPAIVFLQLTGHGPKRENHFAYMVSANRQSGVVFLDPIFNMSSASIISWDSFTRLYQGEALVPNE